LTLIEILVVVAILGLIASVVSVNVVGQWRDSETKAARLDLGQIGSSIDLFRMKYGRYPTSAEGLSVLVEPPNGGESLLTNDDIPEDPWGQVYVYVRRTGGKPPYTLSSKGPDGVLDTEDDVRR